MDVKTASEFLESQYGYYNAIYAYEDLEIHKGTAEEINHYIEQKLSEHSFSWYFAKKFTDFAGLHMPFLQQSCYHFYLFRIHEKVPMNYYIQSLLRQSNIYVGK